MTEATVKLKKDICRCCYTEGIFNNLDVPIVVDGKRELYSDMLDKYLNITLQSTSGLTSMTLTICDLCIHRLIDACKFKIQVLACETKLQQLINESNKVPELLTEENETQIKTGDIQENVEEMQNGEETQNEHEIHNVTEDDEIRQLPTEIDNTRENLKRTLGAQRSTTNALQASSTIEIVNFKENMPINNVEKRELPDMYPNIKISDLDKNRSNISDLYSCTNATPIGKYGGKGYVCCFCTEQFPEASDLKTHTRESHLKIEMVQFMSTKNITRFCIKLDITDLKCSLCEIAINTLEDALLHLLDKHSRPVYTDTKNYIMPFKFDSDSFRCCICENISHTFKSLQGHMNKHYRNFICDVCNAGFINGMKLSRHSISHKVGCFKCDQCPKEFNTERQRRVHEVVVHLNGAFKYKCDYCPEKFKNYNKRLGHLRQVHDINNSPIKCQVCDKTFLERSYLDVHVKRDHLRECRFLCTECGMKFFLATDLKTHMAKHTKLIEYTCAVCLKSYARKNTLIHHMRIHEDNRRFKCEHCGWAYVFKWDWKKHMRLKHLELV